jgi:hypothetical protein
VGRDGVRDRPKGGNTRMKHEVGVLQREVVQYGEGGSKCICRIGYCHIDIATWEWNRRLEAAILDGSLATNLSCAASWRDYRFILSIIWYRCPAVNRRGLLYNRGRAQSFPAAYRPISSSTHSSSRHRMIVLSLSSPPVAIILLNGCTASAMTVSVEVHQVDR